MKSPEFITHGTSSEKDAEKIKNEGFEAQEARATVSGDLIYAFEWATKEERRKGSKSESEIGEEEKGRMVIMKVPKDKSVDYATHTNIEVDESSKEITGYSSKYESGRKQLAIYDEGDVVEKRENIEQAKKELKEIDTQFSTFFKENNIDPNQTKSKEDLIEAIKPFDIEKKIEILEKAEELEKQRTEKRKLAEPNVAISQENILMSVVPTAELGKKLGELSQKIRGLEKVELENFTEELSKIIEDNKENFLASGLVVREVVGNLLTSTMETEVVNMVRSLSMDVKRAQGYEIYNRGKDEIKGKEIDKEQLKQKIEKILSIVKAENFDIGMENLNRYIKINIKKFMETLKEVSPKQESSESILSSELQSKIKLLDESIFPDKPLDVRLDKDTESGAEASHHFDENDSDNEKEHFYTVWGKSVQNKLNENDNPKKEVLRIALHEVRHRVQHDLNTQMLNINDLKQFMVENPKTLLEVYFSSPDYKDFIDYAANKSDNDFDAMVVEDIAIKLLKGNYSDENIKKIASDIVKQPADVILDYLRKMEGLK